MWIYVDRRVVIIVILSYTSVFLNEQNTNKKE